MDTRRTIMLAGVASVVGMGMGSTSSCSTTLDPTTIANAIKVACGIAVPVTAVVSVINATAGATASLIVSLVCSSYKNSAAAAADAAAAKGSGKEAAVTGGSFTVHVCDTSGACKDIPVTYTK